MGVTFNKSLDYFPAKAKTNFLSHCAVSPLYHRAAEAMIGFHRRMSEAGITALGEFTDLLPRFRRGFGTLLKTDPTNISYVHTTAEALCQIANGYPFEPGDQIVSYMHEYPSNHYAWLMQQHRGVELLLLPNSGLPDNEHPSLPCAWSMADLEQLCTSRTRVVAVSHVQFTSGFAADLQALGMFCQARGIDLIVDCAQSLGGLPVYPEQYHIAALAASGWKWLMSTKGSAVLYTSPDLRDKLVPTMAGPSMMQQQLDYLDLSWNPYRDGRLLEYSTLPWDHVAGFVALLEDLFCRYPAEAVRDEVFRLQDVFLANLDQQKYSVVRFEDRYRSGILSLVPKRPPEEVLKATGTQNLVLTERGGYLRVAPHFYLDDDQLVQAAEILNEIG